MKLFFDENFSPHLAKGFSAFQDGRKDEGVEVWHTIDAFGRGTPDEKWIPEVARMHGAVITQDFNIHRTRQFADLCRQHKIGIFFFRPPKKQAYDYWKRIGWILDHWEQIKTIAKSDAVPYEYAITPRSSKPEKL